MFMKNLRLLWVLLASVFMIGSGCSREEEAPAFTVEGRWALIRYDAPGEEPGVGASVWEESYVFRPDGTFTKTRTIDDNVSEATGTYAVSAPEPASETVKFNVELAFETGAGLVGDCTPGTESLIVNRNQELHNTWPACNGPAITYIKVD